MDNLMPKIAEMLGVELGEFVVVESVETDAFWKIALTEDGLIFDKEHLVSMHYSTEDLPILALNQEEFVLSRLLCGKIRIKSGFPKDGERVFAFSNGELYGGNRHPNIQEFSFDSKSQFHLLLKEKGLLHKTLEEAVKCFEKDYNTFKEIQDA